MEKINSFESIKRPLVIAHRGYKGSYPENTISSFEAAIEVEADMIELDVCLSSDRVPVVIHDKSLERTTDGEGLVSERSLAELKELDAGSWFKQEYKGEKIPTLEETLEQIRGRIKVNIEIKPEAFESSRPFDAIEIQICNLVEKFEMRGSVLISSFQHSYFQSIKSFYKKFNKQNIIRVAPIEEISKSTESVLSLCRMEQVFSYHPNERFVTRDLIREIIDCGYKIFPYTVNDENRMEYLIKSGVSGIISDEPEILMNVIKNIYKKN